MLLSCPVPNYILYQNRQICCILSWNREHVSDFLPLIKIWSHSVAQLSITKHHLAR